MQESTLNKLNAIGSSTMLGAVKQMSLAAQKEAEQIKDSELKEEVIEQNKDITNTAIDGLSADKFTQLMYMRQRQIIKDNKIGRNDPCPCGSQKKYKNCCLNSGKYETYTRL